MHDLSAVTLRLPNRGQSKIIAVFSYRYDAGLVPALIQNISPFVHGYVSLDDRKSDAVMSDEPSRRNALHKKARDMGADWILAVDPDERFEYSIADRIQSMTSRRDQNVIWKFNLREMFSPNKYRTDGRWGHKSQIRLYPASATLIPLEKSLHGLWISSKDGYSIRDSALNLYHLRHASLERSQHRRDTYAAADPERRFNPIGYDYLSDMRGAIMKTIPPERMFFPPHIENHELWAAPSINSIGLPVEDPVPVKLNFIRSSQVDQGSDAAAHVAHDLTRQFPKDSDLKSVAACLADKARRPGDALMLLDEDKNTGRFSGLLDELTTARALSMTIGQGSFETLAENHPTRKSGSVYFRRMLEDIGFDEDSGNVEDPLWRRWVEGPVAIHEGSQNGNGPLAVIIPGYQAQPSLAPAVESIRSQSQDVEIVVVNSGGGNVREVLKEHLHHIRLVDVESRLFVGAARNIGIGACRSKFISFLAGDCVALPGWVEGRLQKHKAGALMVSTAVVPSNPNSMVGMLVNLLVFPRRSPALNEDEVIHFGISYHRSVFWQVGYFATGMRVGEDSEFNARAKILAMPVWTPEVVARHEDPKSILSLLVQIYGRARRQAPHIRPRQKTNSGRDNKWIIAATERKAIWKRHDTYLKQYALSALRRRFLNFYIWLGLGAFKLGLRKEEAVLAKAESLARNAQNGKADDPGGALGLMREAVVLAPQIWNYPFILGNAILRTERRDTAVIAEAVGYWLQTMSLKPTAHQPLARIAKVMNRRGNATRALELIEVAAHRAPNLAKTHKLLAEVALDARLHDIALLHGQIALSVNPADAETHTILAKVHRRSGRLKQANRRRVMARRLLAYEEIRFDGN